MARLFTVASDETLIAMIWVARERFVIVAPGLSRDVAAALADRIREDGGPPDLSITLDADPEICRLGYGEIEALELLRPALKSRELSLQMQAGVRIGLVVADADVLVYSPRPSSSRRARSPTKSLTPFASQAPVRRSWLSPAEPARRLSWAIFRKWGCTPSRKRMWFKPKPT
jgi:hypothetical protein